MGYKFIFPIFFEDLMYATTWLKLLMGWRAPYQISSYFLFIESWFFIFFALYIFLHGCTWFHFQYDHFDLNKKSWIFFENLQVSQRWNLKSRHLSTKIILTTCTYKYKGGIWAMCAQFNVEQFWKDPKKNGMPSNFGVKKFIIKKSKKKLWCLNIINSWIIWNEEL